MHQQWITTFKECFPDIRTITDGLMADYTYFEIGGKADLIVFPSCKMDIQNVYCWCLEHGVPCTVVGNGSNLLVSDLGIRGVVLKIDEHMATITVEGNTIKAGAGALLSRVAQVALEHSLQGMAFASGIPGSIGGAVYMNAGAYEGEMKHIVKAADVVTATGKWEVWDLERLSLDYRNSAVATEGALITAVELELQPGDPQLIKAEMQKLNRWRRERQPLAMPSAGSTFKRPLDVAGSYLIDQTGLKGYTIGGAQVSTKHAGFIVNIGDATAQDVLDLIAYVQERVYAKYERWLDPEVRFVGEPHAKHSDD